eukprot:2358895-Amphidinium_carterae.1
MAHEHWYLSAVLCWAHHCFSAVMAYMLTFRFGALPAMVARAGLVIGAVGRRPRALRGAACFAVAVATLSGLVEINGVVYQKGSAPTDDLEAIVSRDRQWALDKIT